MFEKKEKLKVGVIGVGVLGKHHTRLYNENPDTELVGVYDISKSAAKEVAAQYGVEFLYRDFRPYFRAGQEKARELGFYIQKYCGCVFSEEERYLKANKIIP